MKQYAKVTPEGSRDLLFEECDDRRRVENALTGLYEANGYRKVITPTLEFFDVFNSGDAGLDADEMYKLTDNRGRTTVLRPDNTLPIARLVATRLSEDAFPVRLYYNQSVFVRTKELAGRTDEVAQSGIELIGDGSMAADIQVITLACRAMQSTVPGFKIELGHAGYFGAVLRNLNVKPAVKAEICHLIEQKNFAALGDLLDTLEDCRETRVLRRLPRLFGGPEVLDEARELYTEGGADASLQYIKTLYDTLCAAGLQEQVLLDLGIVNRSNYYTGVIFRGYVQGSGLTVLSGGRYDNLLGEFGTDKPAIGFAVDVSAVTDVLHEEINLDRPLRIALTKGTGLEKASVQMFKTMGLNTEALENKGRRLILPVDQYEAVLSKAPDVITYVEHGVCDIGIVGKDTIVEHGSAFYEVLDLNIGRCAFALATKKGTDFFSGYKRKTVASKYPKVAKEFFKSKGMDVDVIKIEGSVELAPLLGLADGIVDIVETGSTLKENGLEVVEKIMPISARVIVNMASMKLRKDEIEAFLHDIELAAQVG